MSKSYIKIEVNKPISCVIRKFIGEVDGDYGKRHEWDVHVGNEFKTFSCSEWVSQKMQAALDAGVKNVILSKVFKDGKYYINVDEDKGVTQTLVQQAERVFAGDPGPTPPPNTGVDWDAKEKKMGRGACWNAAVQYVLAGSDCKTLTVGTFRERVAEVAEQLVEAQRAFINK